jgi:sulfite exporter TauE/SafE
LGGKFFGPLLAARDWRGVFLAGVFTGFLPCGLVYAFLAVAATASHLWEGALRMTLFGLGTVPLMVIAGVGGNALGLAARRHVFRVAAICVALAGVVSIVRGAMFIYTNDGSPDAACPFCE